VSLALPCASCRKNPKIAPEESTHALSPPPAPRGPARPPRLAAAAQAPEAWPGARPVTIVVSWAPGGSTDFVARVLAQQLSTELGGSVVVDNRPGASGTVGHASVARARPDGYTLLLGVNSTYAMARHLFPQRGYDDETAFAPIGRVAASPIILCTNRALGVRDIAGLIERAKAAPGGCPTHPPAPAPRRISRRSCSCARPASRCRTSPIAAARPPCRRWWPTRCSSPWWMR
jgi:hypothetical protein